MRTIAIVQARMGSTRLPGKVMREIAGRPMIDLRRRLHRHNTSSSAQHIEEHFLEAPNFRPGGNDRMGIESSASPLGGSNACV